MYGLGGMSSFGVYGWVGGGGSWIRSGTITLRNPADVKAGRTHPNPLCDAYLCFSPYACSKEAPRGKPFKTAEKAREKYPERLRKTIGLGVIRIKK